MKIFLNHVIWTRRKNKNFINLIEKKDLSK
jgi:hypothetical protein